MHKGLEWVTFDHMMYFLLRRRACAHIEVTQFCIFRVRIRVKFLFSSKNDFLLFFYLFPSSFAHFLHLCQVPDRFLEVAQVTLREFFNAIVAGKDADPSWKKAIYKVICKLDSEVPEVFKSPNCLQELLHDWRKRGRKHCKQDKPPRTVRRLEENAFQGAVRLGWGLQWNAF